MRWEAARKRDHLRNQRKKRSETESRATKTTEKIEIPHTVLTAAVLIKIGTLRRPGLPRKKEAEPFLLESSLRGHVGVQFPSWRAKKKRVRHIIWYRGETRSEEGRSSDIFSRRERKNREEKRYTRQERTSFLAGG